MGFEVRVILTISSQDKTRFTSFYKDICLPFVAFVGLKIDGLSLASKQLTDVSWCVENKQFICRVDEFEDEGADLDLDFLIETALEEGWIGSGKLLGATNL